MYERYETFTTAIVKIHRCIHKIKSEVMAEFHLKSPHVSCLYYLGRNDGITASEICDLSAEDKSSISRSVDYLEEHGYKTTVVQPVDMFPFTSHVENVALIVRA